jgi:hypothetical protein
MSLSSFQYSYEISPIMLVGGVASTMPGGILPIVSVMDQANYSNGIASAPTPTDIGEIFGHFKPVPGHSLIVNEIAHYPMANMSVAANAIITHPNTIALEMLVPANATITMQNKLSVITSLKGTLDNHTAQGGYYTVCTPSYIYTGCLLTSLIDATEDGVGSQPQVRWIWSFEQPLVTAASAAQNQAMSKISNRTVDTADPPGSRPAASSVGYVSSSVATSTIPALSGTAGASVTTSQSSSKSMSLSSISPIPIG